jgi:hypothetical protein
MYLTDVRCPMIVISKRANRVYNSLSFHLRTIAIPRFREGSPLPAVRKIFDDDDDATTTTTQFNSIQFNSLLFMCCVNSCKANYRHSTVYNNNNNNNNNNFEFE